MSGKISENPIYLLEIHGFALGGHPNERVVMAYVAKRLRSIQSHLSDPNDIHFVKGLQECWRIREYDPTPAQKLVLEINEGFQKP